MVNTKNSKYFQINSKTDSRNFYEDQWTLINHFPNEKADFAQTLNDWNILQI